MTEFRTTSWSLVFAARSSDQQTSLNALAQLCERYRPAVLAYVKNLCENAHDADDLTQDFFTKLLEQRIDTRADPDRGRFRSFLKVSVANFFHSQLDMQRTQKRSAHKDLPEPAGTQTPEQAFNHAWTKVVLARSLDRLREEALASNKLKLFHAMSPFLLEGAGHKELNEIAGQYGLRANTLAVGLFRMKQRLRELIRAELFETVSNQDQLNAELHDLRQIAEQ
jgi:RNA polymerase sigma factor (sigma-70 family)